MENKKINPQIEDRWKAVLAEEFTKPYFRELKSKLLEEKKSGKTIYPPGPLIFNAFNQTPFDEVKVVIIGQDPYHGPNQAHGLCFSVAKGVHPPPSLVNIFKEIRSDLDIPLPDHGNLEHWAQQGVFLLNTILTVQASKAASHNKFGWQFFTTAAIQKLSLEKEGLVFLLWGKYAQEKVQLIDRNKHHVLMASHPSPFSAHSGFFGCRHFSKTNEYLRENGKDQIDWRLG